MGAFTNLFGNRNSEKFGDSWFNTYYDRYKKAVQAEPFVSPVRHLLRQYYGHFSLTPQRSAAYLDRLVMETHVCTHACVRAPFCGEAMALVMLFVEHPHLTTLYPKYEARYGEIMGDVLAAQRAEDWETMNRLFDDINPTVEKRSPFPIGGQRLHDEGKRVGLW